MGNKSSKARSDAKQSTQVVDLERGEVSRPAAPQIAQRRHKYNAPPPLQLPGQAIETDLEAGIGGYSSPPPRLKIPKIASDDPISQQPTRKKSRGWFSFLKRDGNKSTQLPLDVQLLTKPAAAQATVPAKSTITTATPGYSLNISASVPMAAGSGGTVCQVCGRWASITCDKCSSAAYCGKRCMLQHATVHAAICRQLARERRAQASAVPDIPEELGAVVHTSCSMAQVSNAPLLQPLPVVLRSCTHAFFFIDFTMQTAFALSGMLDPTFLVVQAAGAGRDTSMLEGLMQVEGESRSESR